MSRSPRAEQIDGGDPTFRVELEMVTGKRQIWQDAEALTSSRASEIARDVARRVLGATSFVKHVCVVNERTGFTRDVITWEPTREFLERN